MHMSRKRHTSEIMRQVVESAQKCELCGSKRGLEAHHIVPIAFGGLDDIDNLICVCETCHIRLTPKRTLIKKGLDRNKENGRMFLDFYRMNFENDSVSGVDVMDVFDRWFEKHIGNKTLPREETEKLQKEMKAGQCAPRHIKKEPHHDPIRIQQ